MLFLLQPAWTLGQAGTAIAGQPAPSSLPPAPQASRLHVLPCPARRGGWGSGADGISVPFPPLSAGASFPSQRACFFSGLSGPGESRGQPDSQPSTLGSRQPGAQQTARSLGQAAQPSHPPHLHLTPAAARLADSPSPSMGEATQGLWLPKPPFQRLEDSGVCRIHQGPPPYFRREETEAQEQEVPGGPGSQLRAPTSTQQPAFSF